MKILPGLLLLLQLLLLPLLIACARTLPLCVDAQAPDPSPAPAPAIRCELVALENDSPGAATATFHVTNDSAGATTFHGYSDVGPLYQCEVLSGDAWVSRPLGWCGTGVGEHALAPGASLELRVMVPRDAKSYRYRFGEPPVVTPPVSAAPE